MLKSTVQSLVFVLGLSPFASIAKASSHTCPPDACDCEACDCSGCDACPCED